MLCLQPRATLCTVVHSGDSGKYRRSCSMNTSSWKQQDHSTHRSRKTGKLNMRETSQRQSCALRRTSKFFALIGIVSQRLLSDGDTPHSPQQPRAPRQAPDAETWRSCADYSISKA
jgi:hypothetical protein